MRSPLKTLGAILVSSMAVIASGPAAALPSNITYTYYYSDVLRLNQVGQQTVGCNGTRTLIGNRTPYFRAVKGESCGYPEPYPF